MTQLVWGEAGLRYFESGVDRGVLYIGDDITVAWNGLVSVSEAPSGGEQVAYYFDGLKYLQVSSNEEYEATIEAFSSPREFDVCDGTATVHPGLYVTQQPRKSFNFCYRSMIGNDTDGLGHGYKIHVVYNALAAPADRGFKTTTNSTDPITMSWAIQTLPPEMVGYKPSAHLIIDSRVTSDALMQHIEEILYGSEDTDGRLPDLAEFLEMFITDEPFIVALVGEGHYTAEGYGVVETVPGVAFTLNDDSVTDYGTGVFDIEY